MFLLTRAISMFLWPLITGALLTNAQYSQVAVVCDSTRLIRCQQDAIRDMQSYGGGGSLNAANVQYPLSGPPYSPKTSQQLLVSPNVCRTVRSNLDCLLATTPACYDSGIQAAQNTDIIHRAKRFLEQNGCNAPDSTWAGTLCYLSPEMRLCEERYGFSGYSSNQASSTSAACLAYQAFKPCVESHLRLNCKVHEMDMINEYLIDKASDLSWRCLHNISSSSSANYLSPYQQLSQQSYNNHYGHTYEQRPIPTYVGGSNVNLFSGSRDQAWERFRNPFDEARGGISRLPGGLGEAVSERLVVEAENSDCIIKAAPYARECEDNFTEQRRSRDWINDSNENTRRICCAFHQYRDCLSRVVLDRCVDSSPAIVEALMGIKRREYTYTCRGFSRDICSGALASAILNVPLLAVALLVSFMTLNKFI